MPQAGAIPRKKRPALAGLFFALALFCAGAPLVSQSHQHRLSSQGQQFFRRFIEQFTPLVLNHEKQRANFRWDKKNHDCAGLVRYLFWEAIQPHAESFFAVYPSMRSVPIPADYGEFRKLGSVWAEGNFTASQLIKQTNFQGRNLAAGQLKTGDLFYFQSAELKIRHVMLVIRAGANVFLVYHTGDEKNDLRIRTVADILALPEAHWHADTQNPVFQGVYRPIFLE